MPNAKSLALCLALTASGCASVPSYRYDDEAQRYKEGSVAHAYGAALVLTGVAGLLSGAATAIAIESGDTGGKPAVALIPIGIGAIFLLLGTTSISTGNNLFTPSTWEISDGARAPALPVSPAESEWQACRNGCGARQYQCGAGPQCKATFDACVAGCGARPAPPIEPQCSDARGKRGPCPKTE